MVAAAWLILRQRLAPHFTSQDPKVSAGTSNDVLRLPYFETQLIKVQISSEARAAFGRKLIEPDRTQMVSP